VAADALAAAPPAVPESLVEREARGLQRRRQPEDDAGEQRERGGEGEGASVDGDVLHPGQAIGGEGEQRAHAPLCDQHPQRASQQRQQDALGEQLAHDAAAAGAQRRPHGDLLARAVARASSRLATLAHAMSRRNPTAPSNVKSTGRASPTRASSSGLSLTPQPL
jgi:hypothetical protein